jgi:thiamine-phosphate diphosphorylase
VGSTGPRSHLPAVRECLLQQLKYAIDAGVDILQIRERELSTLDLAELVSDTVALARGSTSRVVVNDRLDVALACGAAGVHLRSDSAPAAVVRAATPPGFLVGRSVHHVDEAVVAARHADYLIAGTIWPSESKPNAPPLLGLDGLAAIVRAVSVPVLAIGGVNLHRMQEVAAAGAAGVAGIGLFMEPYPHQLQNCRAIPVSHIVRAGRAGEGTSR